MGIAVGYIAKQTRRRAQKRLTNNAQQYIIINGGDKVLSLKQVADILNVSRQTVLNWVKSGYVKAVKIGRQYRIEQSEIERLRSGK